jgi:hypothetical protein
MRRIEEQHNTPEQVSGYLQTALGIIEGCDVPDDLREAAFTAVVNLVASKQLIFEQSAMIPDLGVARGRH